MASTPEGNFYEQVPAALNILNKSDRITTRLTGDLAATTSIAASATATERIKVKGALRVRVLIQTSGDGTFVASLTPVLSDDTSLSTKNIVTTEATQPTGTEISLSFDCYGETFLMLTVTEDGAANPVVITFVDVNIL